MKTRRAPLGEAGYAVIEFAFTFGLLWMGLAGVFEVGYTLYVYKELERSVTQAAQAGAAGRLPASTPAAFEKQIRNLVVYGNECGTGRPLVPRLTTANVIVRWEPQPGEKRVGAITVAVTGYEHDALFQTLRFNGRPRATAALASKSAAAKWIADSVGGVLPPQS